MSSLNENFSKILDPSGLESRCNWIQLAYGLPFTIIMIWMVVRLGRKKFYGDFIYHLFRLDLIMNIACYINTWFGLRLSQNPLGVLFMKSVEYHAPGVWTVMRFSLNFFYHTQFWSTFGISLYRFTLVASHFDKHQASIKKLNLLRNLLLLQCWPYCYWKFYIIFIVCSLVPLGFQIGLVGKFPSQILLENDNLMINADPADMKKLFLVNACSSIGYFVVTVGFGICLIVTYKQKTREMLSNHRKTIESLTKIVVILNALDIWAILWNIVEFWPNLLPFISDEQLMILLPFFSDMITFQLPILLLLIDRNVQRDFRRIWSKPKPNSLFLHRNGKVNVTPSAANQMSLFT